MTEVLTVPRTPSGEVLYQSTGLPRSHPSSGSLFIGSPPISTSPINASYVSHAEHQERRSSPPMSSSLPTSTSTSSSDLPTFDAPTTSSGSGGLSLEQKFSQEEDVGFPDYGGVQFHQQDESYEESQSSEEPVGSITTETTVSDDSPLPTPTVADDTAIKQEPKQHVDYLSHDWREEDIWSSWRHIVSQRKVYGQRSRLENASWRTWAKSKYHLRTVSPETLNWLKESDVTWLYGPLKPADSHPITSNQSEPSSQLSKSNSFVNKKPILKKRSMSEVMLQKSISATSLVKQAAASVQAQQTKQPQRAAFQRAKSDFISSGLNSEATSRDQFDYFTSQSSSENGTPCEWQAKRHIRFDDKVEQCIAVECKEDHEEEVESEEEEEAIPGSEDSSSDDGVIMMKRKKRSGLKKDAHGSRSSSSNGRKMIETLPASTLKYRTDSPDVTDAQQHHTFGRNWGAGKLSPSPSQETLRPSRPSANFLLNDEDDEGEADTSSSWSFGASNPKSSLGSASSSDDETTRTRRRGEIGSSKARASTPAPDEYTDNLRRTNSGMLMPYDDEEDDAMAVGLFGKVSETINTAKDIAHVIWNVGWRK